MKLKLELVVLHVKAHVATFVSWPPPSTSSGAITGVLNQRAFEITFPYFQAQAFMQEAENCNKKKGKKPVLEGEIITKQTLMDMAVIEQQRAKLEMEKRIKKLAKTMDYLERAKREEAAPLIDAAFQQCLAED
ncbi:hypothetical protein ACS0TY_001264 [Phlomoides rotata]